MQRESAAYQSERQNLPQLSLTAGGSIESPFVSTGGPLAAWRTAQRSRRSRMLPSSRRLSGPVRRLLRNHCLLRQRPRLNPHLSESISAAAQEESQESRVCIKMQALSAVSAQYRAVQQATAERLVAKLFARQASAPAEMLRVMIQGGAEDDLDVQARLALCGVMDTHNHATAAVHFMSSHALRHTSSRPQAYFMVRLQLQLLICSCMCSCQR